MREISYVVVRAIVFGVSNDGLLSSRRAYITKVENWYSARWYYTKKKRGGVTEDLSGRETSLTEWYC